VTIVVGRGKARIGTRGACFLAHSIGGRGMAWGGAWQVKAAVFAAKQEEALRANTTFFSH